MIFELATFDFKNALQANITNVDRIELCHDYSSGGITPDIKLIESVLKFVTVDVFIMIRCRSGNFVYNENESTKMINDIDIFKRLNVNGFVFGALNSNNQVDESVCKKIIDKAHPLPVTFHRAFDSCTDLYQSSETIIKCGFKRILTSGGNRTAYEGRFRLKKLIEK